MKLFILFIIFYSTLFGFTILPKGSQNIAKFMEIAIDSNGSKTAQEILKTEKFKPNQIGRENFGYNQNIFWVKITLTNQNRSTTNRLLELYFPPMDYIDFFEFDDNQTLKNHFESGDLRPLKIRNIDNQYHLFPLIFAPNETKIVLLKLQNSGSMIINPIIHTPANFWEHVYPERDSFIIAFLAIILFFMLYNLGVCRTPITQ